LKAKFDNFSVGGLSKRCNTALQFRISSAIEFHKIHLQHRSNRAGNFREFEDDAPVLAGSNDPNPGRARAGKSEEGLADP